MPLSPDLTAGGPTGKTVARSPRTSENPSLSDGDISDNGKAVASAITAVTEEELYDMTDKDIENISDDEIINIVDSSPSGSEDINDKEEEDEKEEE
ncbi:hypothetical protein BR93DRAFT_972890 [Coniochaeta sp. PMI_546]|nr:hypothetical protein BR93DRAFT_972890 [Coniochaeta sp. PMI_546]